MKTQPSLVPPNNTNNNTAVAGDDYIQELGDRIAGLNMLDAKELSRYIKWRTKHGRKASKEKRV